MLNYQIKLQNYRSSIHKPDFCRGTNLNCGRSSLGASKLGKNPTLLASDKDKARVQVRNYIGRCDKLNVACKSTNWDEVDTFLRYSLVAGSLSGIVYSASEALVGPCTLPQSKSDGIDDFGWGIMGVVSFMPMFNSLSWVFGAMQDERRAGTYYFFAALYAAPFLRCGLDLDAFYWGMAALGAAHLQVERIACTEPELIRGLPASRAILDLPRRLSSFLPATLRDDAIRPGDLDEVFRAKLELESEEQEGREGARRDRGALKGPSGEGGARRREDKGP